MSYPCSKTSHVHGEHHYTCRMMTIRTWGSGSRQIWVLTPKPEALSFHPIYPLVICYIANWKPWPKKKQMMFPANETSIYIMDLPSGKVSHNYGKSPFSMGKSTINHHFHFHGKTHYFDWAIFQFAMLVITRCYAPMGSLVPNV